MFYTSEGCSVPNKHCFGPKCAFWVQKGPFLAVKSIFTGTGKEIILKKGILSPNIPNPWVLDFIHS
jgi:hypothetical protein